jgi:integrase/recombinase XerD
VAAVARSFHSDGSSQMAKVVGEFIDYLQRRGASSNTISAYRSDLEQLAYFMETNRMGDVYSALDRSAIEQFVDGLKEHGYREASVARKLAAARSFFVFLAGEGAVSANPAAGLTGPRVARPLPSAISAEEIARLLQQAARRATPEARRDRAMLELLYATGMRVSELVSLDIDDIDVEGRRPHVRFAGRRGAERMVPIPKGIQELLLRYLDTARPLLARNEDERALFVNRRGGRITRQGLWFILKGYARAAGSPVRVTPNTLRHSFAAHKLRRGVPLDNVQQMLGHSAPSSTRIYAPFSSDQRTAGS